MLRDLLASLKRPAAKKHNLTDSGGLVLTGKAAVLKGLMGVSAGSVRVYGSPFA